MAETYLGEIRLFGGDFAPVGWALCDGQSLPVDRHRELFDVIGAAFGGDGQSTFCLPDLRGAVPIGAGDVPQGAGLALGDRIGSESVTLTLDELPAHTHAAQASSSLGTASTPRGGLWASSGENAYAPPPPSGPMRDDAIIAAGEGKPHDNMMPFTALSFCISLVGDRPDRSGRGGPRVMLGDIRLFATTRVGDGWTPCDGQELQISDHQALYSIMGSTFGGNGRTRFRVPDLRGRVPVGAGPGHELGAVGGAATHVLSASELPQHTHVVRASQRNGTVTNPRAGGRARAWAAGGADKPYATSANTALDRSAIAPTGGGRPHDNTQPSVALGYFVATRGIFPLA